MGSLVAGVQGMGCSRRAWWVHWLTAVGCLHGRWNVVWVLSATTPVLFVGFALVPLQWHTSKQKTLLAIGHIL